QADAEAERDVPRTVEPRHLEARAERGDVEARDEVVEHRTDLTADEVLQRVADSVAERPGEEALDEVHEEAAEARAVEAHAAHADGGCARQSRAEHAVLELEAQVDGGADGARAGRDRRTADATRGAAGPHAEAHVGDGRLHA